MKWKPSRTTVVGVTGAVIALVGVIVQLTKSSAIQFVVRQQVQLQEGNDIYELWKEPPITIYMEVYLFNMTNPEEFLWYGCKPKLQEIGPYTYRHVMTKVNVSWDEDKEVITYQNKRMFYFEPERSVGNQTDELLVLNIPLAGLAGVASTKLSRFERLFVNGYIKMFKSTFFVKKTVDEMLFTGYKDVLVSKLQNLSRENMVPGGRFSLFSMINQSQYDYISAYTGKSDPEKFAHIIKWKNQSTVEAFGNTSCSEIRGTDGMLFPAFVDKTKPLYAFAPEICRTSYIRYLEDSNVHGIPTYRYHLPFEARASPVLNPKNKCFCELAEDCMGSGLLDMSVCNHGAPIMASNPHFFQTEKVHVESVYGMKPEQSKHETWADVEPITGAVIRGARKLQVNIRINKVDGIQFYNNITNVLLPIVWFSESASIDEEWANFLWWKLHFPLKFLQWVSIIAICVGVPVLIGAILFHFFCRNKKPQMPKEAKFKQTEMEKIIHQEDKDVVDPLIKTSMTEKVTYVKNEDDSPTLEKNGDFV